MLNAIFYVVKAGGQWTQLPTDFPPHRRVCPYDPFISAEDLGGGILGKLTVLSRVHAGKRAFPPTVSSIVKVNEYIDVTCLKTYDFVLFKPK